MQRQPTYYDAWILKLKRFTDCISGNPPKKLKSDTPMSKKHSPHGRIYSLARIMWTWIISSLRNSKMQLSPPVNLFPTRKSRQPAPKSLRLHEWTIFTGHSSPLGLRKDQSTFFVRLYCLTKAFGISCSPKAKHDVLFFNSKKQMETALSNYKIGWRWWWWRKKKDELYYINI